MYTKKSKCNRILCRIATFLVLKAFRVENYSSITDLQLMLQKEELIRQHFRYDLFFNKNKFVYEIPVDIS